MFCAGRVGDLLKACGYSPSVDVNPVQYEFVGRLVLDVPVTEVDAAARMITIWLGHMEHM
jgi:hypothetical protein